MSDWDRWASIYTDFLKARRDEGRRDEAAIIWDELWAELLPYQPPVWRSEKSQETGRAEGSAGAARARPKGPIRGIVWRWRSKWHFLDDEWVNRLSETTASLLGGWNPEPPRAKASRRGQGSTRAVRPSPTAGDVVTGKAFRNLVYRIARNLLIDHVRRIYGREYFTMAVLDSRGNLSNWVVLKRVDVPRSAGARAKRQDDLAANRVAWEVPRDAGDVTKTPPHEASALTGGNPQIRLLRPSTIPKTGNHVIRIMGANVGKGATVVLRSKEERAVPSDSVRFLDEQTLLVEVATNWIKESFPSMRPVEESIDTKTSEGGQNEENELEEALDVRAREGGPGAAEERQPGAFKTPEEEYAAREQEGFIYKALAQLPSAEREAVWLRYLGDATIPKIAETLGHPEKKIVSLLREGVDRMQELMEAQGRNRRRAGE